ncbi:hypothetical protein B4U79_16615 [Dinothrombium tinctorium]|uniref:glucan endo-1,3-beta-D-glucosidase n=1 Tax=Dinothrombium tinctorium TaxID=1965070 RepID=A0A3S3RJB1_9ACAR|nr:hypothetical protein B4U79_16684 [Dinothrombium tinctorium]RWS02453.1 hypothetical protein B4U79_16615 [Dinothrombium tinctorium]
MLSINFDRNYIGVAFSPYTKQTVNGQLHFFNNSDITDVKRQLAAISSRFNRIATYGMGTAFYNRFKDWDKADSNCLIAKAAAEINAQIGRKIFTISQGVYQKPNDELQRIEIERAFRAAEYANRVFPGTVESIIFTNEYFTENSRGLQVLEMIRSNKERARQLGLAIGTRTHVGGHILNPCSPSFAALKSIVEISDIIMCNIYPTSVTARASVDIAVETVTQFYWALRNCFTNINPKIKVIIGESGWASQGKTSNDTPTSVSNLVNYWTKLGHWASFNKIPIYFFEAIDEPWKGDINSAEAHFGWWIRNGDTFVEKACFY